jgi:hypothetical protein
MSRRDLSDVDVGAQEAREYERKHGIRR